MFFILVCIHDVQAIEIDRLESKFGTINVEGPVYNKQVYLSAHGKKRVLTIFPKWERVENLFLSPDQKYLAIYHKPDKKAYRFLLYDLQNLKPVAEVRPGLALTKLFWHENRILYETDMTSYGRMITIYDMTLKPRGNFSAYELELNFEAGYALEIPVFGVENGIFEVYSLEDGTVIEQFDFTQEMGQPYEVKRVDRVSNTRYRFELTGEKDYKYGLFIREVPSLKHPY